MIVIIVNRNISKVDKIIQKQIGYLNGPKSNYYFEKNHYSFGFSSVNDHFYVNFTIEEQWSGSCWADGLDEPKEYVLDKNKVESAIRVVLSAILPKIKKKELNEIARNVFLKMKVSNYSNHEYYGNYEKWISYAISVENIYEEINEFIHENMWKIDKVINL